MRAMPQIPPMFETPPNPRRRGARGHEFGRGHHFGRGRGLFVVVVLVLIWAALFALPWWNRVAIHRNRANYRPATFLVSDAAYERGKRGTSYWLQGSIAGESERFVPPLADGAARPRNRADLLRQFPVGTKIAVLYNPSMTRALIQDETLRVKPDAPDFWQREARLRRSLTRMLFGPPAAGVAILVAVRWWWRRRLGGGAGFAGAAR